MTPNAKRALLGATAILLPTGAANAQCVLDDGDVVCTGTDTDGFSTDQFVDRLIVAEDAAVSADENAVAIEGGVQDAQVDGTLTGGVTGLVIDGASRATFGANSTVSGGEFGIVATGGRFTVGGEVSGGTAGFLSDTSREDTDLTVTADGAITSADGTAVLGRNRLDVTVSGLASGGQAGVDVTTGSVRVTETGTVRSSASAVVIQAGNATTSANVDNSGLIEGGATADGRGIDGTNAAGAGVENEGTITAGGNAVTLGDDAFVGNSGEIVSTFGTAVQIGDNGASNNSTIFNAGTLRGAEGASIRSGIVENAGPASLIEGTDGSGLVIADSAYDDEDVSVRNEGTIRGTVGIERRGQSDDTAVTIRNFGLIEGTDGVAVSLGGSDDTVIVGRNGEIMGDVLLGGGDDRLVFEAGSYPFGGSDAGLFDLGEGEDTIALPLAEVAVLGVFMSETFSDAFELRVRSRGTVLTFAGAEFFEFSNGDRFAIADFVIGDAVPLPAGAVLFASALGLGSLVRRRKAG